MKTIIQYSIYKAAKKSIRNNSRIAIWYNPIFSKSAQSKIRYQFKRVFDTFEFNNKGFRVFDINEKRYLKNG